MRQYELENLKATIFEWVGKSVLDYAKALNDFPNLPDSIYVSLESTELYPCPNNLLKCTLKGTLYTFSTVPFSILDEIQLEKAKGKCPKNLIIDDNTRTTESLFEGVVPYIEKSVSFTYFSETSLELANQEKITKAEA